jgi:pyrroloquinoline quinone biosynthesis protein B
MRYLIFFLLFAACATSPEQPEEFIPDKLTTPYLVVLGIAQDAGYPQSGCHEACCAPLWYDKSKREMVSSLGLIDPFNGACWIFDATPDFKDQLVLLDEFRDCHPDIPLPDGIFLTHAHIGHYTGLMHLGREAMGAKDVPVYAMPKMREFLKTNGPWSQLVDLENIHLKALQAEEPAVLNDHLSVIPFSVPHRDEFSETVGFKIIGPQKSALFIPDIDKWEKWDEQIEALVAEVDFAIIDGTFFRNGEIPRDMSEVPHPFVEETMQRFENLPAELRAKIYFIHFNHTNPIMNPDSKESIEVLANGFNICREGMVLGL